MRARKRRRLTLWLVVFAALASTAGLFHVTRGGDEEAVAPQARQASFLAITLRGGVPMNVVKRSVNKGDLVELDVQSDAADEIHVEGYQVSGRVAASSRARISFWATTPGRFDIVAQSGAQIAELTVER